MDAHAQGVPQLHVHTQTCTNSIVYINVHVPAANNDLHVLELEIEIWTRARHVNYMYTV